VETAFANTSLASTAYCGSPGEVFRNLPEGLHINVGSPTDGESNHSYRLDVVPPPPHPIVPPSTSLLPPLDLKYALPAGAGDQFSSSNCNHCNSCTTPWQSRMQEPPAILLHHQFLPLLLRGSRRSVNTPASSLLVNKPLLYSPPYVDGFSG